MIYYLTDAGFVVASQLLVASGRKARINDLALAKAGVTFGLLHLFLLWSFCSGFCFPPGKLM